MELLPWPLPFPSLLPVHWGYVLRRLLCACETHTSPISPRSGSQRTWYRQDIHAWHLQLKLKKMKHGDFSHAINILTSPYSMTKYSQRPDAVIQTISHSSPSLILMTLYTLRKSSLVNIFVPCTPTKGNKFQYFTVMTFKSLYSIQCLSPILFSHEKRSLYWLRSMQECAWS